MQGILTEARTGLMFYELNTQDPMGKNPWKRGTSEYTNGSFAGDQNLLSKITEYVNPDAKLAFEDYIQDEGGESASNDIMLPQEGAIKVPNILPDG